MSTIQGTITQIVPDGGYSSQNGYINTFQMTVQDANGNVYTGQIGSKSQQYPLGIGQPINVEMTNSAHGVRFKKFNPQYGAPQSQGQQQNPPQGPPPASATTSRPTAWPQTPQNPPQGPQQPAKAPDWDAKDERIVRQNTLNRAVELFIKSHETIEWPLSLAARLELAEVAECLRDYVYSGYNGKLKTQEEKDWDNVPGHNADETIPY